MIVTETAAKPARKPLPDEAPHVLVVDDDRRLRDLLGRFLGDNGYRVTTAASAAEADTRLGHLVFDAIVLDVMMPGENGFEFARRFRSGSAVPILMLTARADGKDRINGLEIGVDDYLAKPFEPRELLLRLGNILKRTLVVEAAQSGPRPDFVRFGPFLYGLNRGELHKGDEAIRLTEREREILTALAERAGEVVRREELAAQGSAANDRTVDVQMNRLRRKIERDPADPLYLQTVRGVGYRLVTDRT
ncbi:two-component system response regulator [Bosea thiooxidans]|uniref:Two-component system response regulator n=1 Tax=Bosea thiooxidans TaxID=53254 RepID=A0A0Q3I8L0_9HYPH|nr:response regulator transcription factor [Bosea thiooxidans]KQK31352.1 two-component system response regulator [Bosea thiooxidans]SKB38549.1 two-component system, OmpR family, phosphate regulon response regulator OmpR [Bosea thiooxidans]